MIHGEPTASETLARKIRENFELEVHIPKWRERLILKEREVTREPPARAEAVTDLRESMLNMVTGLEDELRRLREEVRSKPLTNADPDDLDRLRYMKEEIRSLLADIGN